MTESTAANETTAETTAESHAEATPETTAETAAETAATPDEVTQTVPEAPTPAPAPRAPRSVPRTERPIQTVGRRKEAIVRVRVIPGTGKFVLNGRSLETYFPSKVHQQLDPRAAGHG